MCPWYRYVYVCIYVCKHMARRGRNGTTVKVASPAENGCRTRNIRAKQSNLENQRDLRMWIGVIALATRTFDELCHKRA